MKFFRGLPISLETLRALALGTGIFFITSIGLSAEQLNFSAPSDPGGQSKGNPGIPAPVCEPASLDSPYVPVDSWMYPAVLRLYSLGMLDHVFLGMRPWTRSSIANMLEDVAAHLEDADPGDTTDQAQELYDAIAHELRYDVSGPCMALKGNTRIESIYTVARAISGTPLRDSYHLGSTIINDYGRPYSNGFNNYSGSAAMHRRDGLRCTRAASSRAHHRPPATPRRWPRLSLSTIGLLTSTRQRDCPTIRQLSRWGQFHQQRQAA